jgi:hypothetical protein
MQAGMHNNPRQLNLIQQQQAQAGRTAPTGSMLPPHGFPTRISPPIATPLSHTAQLAAPPQIANHQRTPSNPAMRPPGDLLGQQAMRNVGSFMQQPQQMMQPPQHSQMSAQGFNPQHNLGGMGPSAGSWSGTNGLDPNSMVQQLAGGGVTQMQGVNYGMMNGMMGGVGQPLQHQQWSGPQSGVNTMPSMTGLTPAAILQQQQQQPKPAVTNVPTTIDPSMFMNWSDMPSS